MRQPDFTGYASKNDLLCADGRTIRAGAFAHMDGKKVPLVWNHQHNNPGNILGHAILENRPDGVYTRAYFNDTPAAAEAKEMLRHGDIEALSIYANRLVERAKNVMHGVIQEVSLVLSGANPGAFIDSVSFAHGDNSEVVEAIIYTDEPIEFFTEDSSREEEKEEVDLSHADDSTNNLSHNSTKSTEGDTVAETSTKDKTVQDVYDEMTEEQKNVVHFLVGQAVEDAEGGDKEMAQSAIDAFKEGFTEAMNVFDQNGSEVTHGATLSHSQFETIISDAQRVGSLKESFLSHAAEYGIENIDILFPDAKAVANSPEVISRRMEWVSDVLAKVRKSPFSRIKSTAVDLTADEARAKGYVKGNLKKDEVIKLLKRVTTPTTVYKKQKLDRDDVVDITDIDVIAWLKAEMRVMLDEEIARAILIGDGREPDDEDKINEDHIRPIAWDADMYAHQVNLASGSTPAATIEAIVRARRYFKGTGQPTLYTTDEVLTDLILDKDTLGRRYYNTEAELAAALRVSSIVTVEAMEAAPDVLGIIVNLADYTVGADKGGQVAMFDDFDIDYNQQKYLIETRISGALTKPKSAIVIKQSSGTVITPQQPAFDNATDTITIPTQTGVVYSIDGVDVTGNVVITEITDVEARPAPGYSFPHNTDSDWVYNPA